MRPATFDPHVPAPASPLLLSDAERNPPCLTLQDSMLRAVDAFNGDTDLRLMPVLDAERRPIGAIFEKDVRRMLLNPFGHALLRNPSYGHGLSRHLRPCPVAEVSAGIGMLIDAYRAANGSEGMILTLGGRLHAVVNNRRLVHLAAEREREAAAAQLARAERIEAAGARFETQVTALGSAMRALAEELEAGAAATVGRQREVGERAVAVASAASQTSGNMAEIAGRGRVLAEALGSIGRSALEANAAAGEAAALVEAGGARTRELLRAAHSIDAVIALISEIAGQVNLLALNATIEAARAGEAGRGFTVVANEVKQLSNQTGNAAQRIARHVGEIRRGIDDVAQGHAQVERAIGAMTQLAGQVEAAVHLQEEATRTIARNVEEAVDASNGIQSDVEAIGSSAQAATDSAVAMRRLAEGLQQGAGALAGQLDAFLVELHAA